jgi:hypothetical protein
VYVYFADSAGTSGADLGMDLCSYVFISLYYLFIMLHGP